MPRKDSSAFLIWASVFAVNVCFLLFLGGYYVVANIRFTTECGGHLKRAADANTVELAHKELAQALNYIRQHEMTEGSTGIFFSFPKNDVGFWYTNLSDSFSELDRVIKSSPQGKIDQLGEVARSNTLIKLRETLLDHGTNGEEIITLPTGIHIFPHNVGYFSSVVIGILLCVISGVALFLNSDPYSYGSGRLTLVEVLVILAIIGVVVSLIAGAVLQ